MSVSVVSPDPIKIVEDYDFVFMDGNVLPVTLDRKAGDTISLADPIEIFLAAKPSVSDPDRMLPAENITVFKTHLLTIQHRVREVVQLPDNQKGWPGKGTTVSH